CATYYDYFDYW
nr:immunoglobulin heavy chain junction region [Mus musculus]MBK4188177.1 immunoglobulin heavy chain junction region [Mus musculus]